ncbi:MAG TPA: formate dehydrogenase accessory sulfurtransferase FdhD [Kofleriaceae bacterium]|nr:formate dehydrogenase accessory sulfurtransferase FdhD [Kofleriaceae bacterium]
MSRIEERSVIRVDAGNRDHDWDQVVVEAPLELRMAGGRALTTTMRTPGDDLDLARGLLLAEGVLRERAEAELLRAPAPGSLPREEEGNVILIDLEERLVEERWPPRALPISSACGACGAASLAALERRAAPVASPLTVPAALIASLPERLRTAQAVFAATGGLHAAGLFSAAGDLLCAREDVGRHNAVDKVVGWALAAGRTPLHDALLCVSGRLGYEIAQKAVVAGIPIIIAVSAPSTLAVDVAERFRVTLCAFTRGARTNLYSHAWRVI